ncbi:hypothetical protein TRVL_06403 [Trypanosoma vivax]|nr:hypothetical protein TRVL_06403 [Trypanosoma vivax]
MCWRSVSRYAALYFKPSVLRIVLPLVALFLCMSLFWIDSPAGHAFHALDTDGDGFISLSDFEDYYTRVLHRQVGIGKHAESAFPKGVTRINKRQFTSWWSAGHSDPVRQDAFFSQGLWREVEYVFADSLWWLALGILSSIGLGTGMHSGILFLFPYIYLACSAADTCGNTDFWTYPVNPLYGPNSRVFLCIDPTPASTTVSLLQRALKVIPACVLWGAGTAIGEIPPYLLSYTAARQGHRNSELEATSKYNVLNSMKAWTLNRIQRYGFIAVLLLAAWPNMAFDLCGMACGQFLMPFWTFFGATFIGKALIKVVMQAIFFVLLFSGDNIERIVRRLGDLATKSLTVPSFIEPDGGKGLVEKLVVAVAQARESIANRARGAVKVDVKEKPESVIVTLFGWMVTVAVLFFVKSILEAFARSEQEKRDRETLVRVRELFSLLEPGQRMTDSEVREYINIARGVSTNDEDNYRSRLDFAVPLAASLFAVVGFAIGYKLLAVVGLSLLLHAVLYLRRTNDSINQWTSCGMRLTLLSAALYAMHVQQST